MISPTPSPLTTLAIIKSLVEGKPVHGYCLANQPVFIQRAMEDALEALKLIERLKTDIDYFPQRVHLFTETPASQKTPVTLPVAPPTVGPYWIGPVSGATAVEPNLAGPARDFERVMALPASTVPLAQEVGTSNSPTTPEPEQPGAPGSTRDLAPSEETPMASSPVPLAEEQPDTKTAPQSDAVQEPAQLVMPVPGPDTSSTNSKNASSASKQNAPQFALWSDEEDARLETKFKEGLNLSELAQIHQRSYRAIALRLLKLNQITETQCQTLIAHWNAANKNKKN